MDFDRESRTFSGPGGMFKILEGDEASYKLAMLITGECESIGPSKAAELFGFSRQRYFQLRSDYMEKGVEGLLNKKRGPKSYDRRTDEAIVQIVRQSFRNPDASTEAIAKKLQQSGYRISKMSVARVIADYGLHKKQL